MALPVVPDVKTGQGQSLARVSVPAHYVPWLRSQTPLTQHGEVSRALLCGPLVARGARDRLDHSLEVDLALLASAIIVDPDLDHVTHARLGGDRVKVGERVVVPDKGNRLRRFSAVEKVCACQISP